MRGRGRGAEQVRCELTLNNGCRFFVMCILYCIEWWDFSSFFSSCNIVDQRPATSRCEVVFACAGRVQMHAHLIQGRSPVEQED
eukprot:4640151-Pyramimonas_sp.AAC.1